MKKKYGVLCAALWLLTACAVIPAELSVPRQVEQKGPLQFSGASGPLNAKQNQAWQKRLEGQDDTDLLKEHLAVMQAVSSEPLIVGNTVKLLIDGPATQAAMLQAIAQAKTQIHLETYIFEADQFGSRLKALLRQRREQGIEVNVLYDAVGSLATPKPFFEEMRAAGIHVCEFNPVRPTLGKNWSLNQRDHRKILVVDGKVALTGGINISDVYSRGSASARRKKDKDQGWRDTQVEIRGPAAERFQRLFHDSWERQNCGPIGGPASWTPAPAQGDKVVRVIGSQADAASNPIYAEWLSALRHAQRSIHLTMAYFVPDPDTLEALQQAARRGVDVTLILPGFSDFWAVWHAGRAHYADLLKAGVRIYERRDALLHAKTAVVDGVWSTVGSSNLDWRSFLHNDEVNAVVLGPSFGQEMEAMFQNDLARAQAIDPDTWAQRGLSNRLKEWFAGVWEYWL